MIFPPGFVASSLQRTDPRVYPLDAITTLDVIFGMTKLRRTAQRMAFQLCNSSLQTIDIPWIEYEPDMDMVADAIAAGYTRVSRWYDQSGNRLDAIQTTWAKMPELDIDGAYDAAGPALYYDGTRASTLKVAANALINNIFTGGGYIAHTSNIISGGTIGGGFGIAWSKGNNYFGGANNLTAMRWGTDFSTTDGRWSHVMTLNTWYLHEHTYDNGATINTPVIERTDMAGTTVSSAVLAITPVGTASDDSAFDLRIGGSSGSDSVCQMRMTNFMAARVTPT